MTFAIAKCILCLPPRGPWRYCFDLSKLCELKGLTIKAISGFVLVGGAACPTLPYEGCLQLAFSSAKTLEVLCLARVGLKTF